MGYLPTKLRKEREQECLSFGADGLITAHLDNNQRIEFKR
jgi:hypothetical protein